MKKHRQMVENLKKGDKILTQGGLFAEVIQNHPDYLMVRIGKNLEVKLDKSAVARKLDDESEKN